jgi:hypothetical protein
MRRALLVVLLACCSCGPASEFVQTADYDHDDERENVRQPALYTDPRRKPRYAYREVGLLRIQTDDRGDAIKEALEVGRQRGCEVLFLDPRSLFAGAGIEFTCAVFDRGASQRR